MLRKYHKKATSILSPHFLKRQKQSFVNLEFLLFLQRAQLSSEVLI